MWLQRVKFVALFLVFIALLMYGFERLYEVKKNGNHRTTQKWEPVEFVD